MTGVDVIGALRADAERHTRNFGYDGVQNEGLTPGVKVDIKRFPENSAVGVPTAARLGCKTGFALYQIEYGGITQESRAASDRLDRGFPAPLSPALMASMQVPRRQAAAEAPDAAPHRQAAAAAADAAPQAAARRQASERPRGTVATSMASASASVVPPLIPLQKRRIRGISGVRSTESASPTDFPGAPVFDTDTDRRRTRSSKTRRTSRRISPSQTP